MMMLISTMAAMSMYETKKMTGTGATIPSSVNMTRVTEDAHASPVHTCTLGVLEHTHTYTHTLSHTHTLTHSHSRTHTQTHTLVQMWAGRTWNIVKIAREKVPNKTGSASPNRPTAIVAYMAVMRASRTCVNTGTLGVSSQALWACHHKHSKRVTAVMRWCT